ncbi:T-cell surface antigen CD2-like isoform X2 [Nerophis ophidion]|uniref:T-cell surface antigen CD2-like isoform X2 n=1 Tax=Nerophis ophidion TaxID=159077 RepID=UPI002ADF88AF|nr:T-cell surface antigen CD2-like isoform X2 [Nerophis ophidion]
MNKVWFQSVAPISSMTALPARLSVPFGGRWLRLPRKLIFLLVALVVFVVFVVRCSFSHFCHNCSSFPPFMLQQKMQGLRAGVTFTHLTVMAAVSLQACPASPLRCMLRLLAAILGRTAVCPSLLSARRPRLSTSTMKKKMERMAASSMVVFLLLGNCIPTSSDSKDACDAYASIGANFTVPLHPPLQKSQNMKWYLNKTLIFNRKMATGKLNIYNNGSLKLTNLKRNSTGLYVPKMYDTNGKFMGDLRGLFLCVLEPVTKPELKIECDSSNVIFTCVPGQIAAATVEWLQNEKVVKKENKWSLQFVAAEVKNDAFRCNVSNRVSSMSSDSRVQNCTGSNFKIMASILAGMGGLALLLFIVLIFFCVRAAVGKKKQVNEEEELRLGWSNPEPQRGQHRHQQAGQTGPQQPRRKRRRRGSQQLPDPPQCSTGRLAQANTPMANEENPPPVPQPRKKVAAQRM